MKFIRHGILLRSLLTALVLSATASVAAADNVNLEPADFLAGVFGEAVPQVRVLWITPNIRTEAEHILGHEPTQLRQKYWTDGHRTAWILEEIGKEDPITAGFVINDGRIEQARVLVYRESRGGEIRYPSFVAQFNGAALAGDGRLNREIDGISGATLSVNAMLRMSRVALFYANAAAK